jgi:hypothetical protein
MLCEIPTIGVAELCGTIVVVRAIREDGSGEPVVYWWNKGRGKVVNVETKVKSL